MRVSVRYRLSRSRVDPGMLVQGITPMTRMSAVAVALSLASATMFSNEASYAQAKPGVERLYILNCGEGVAGDISWDTGVTDAIAAMPDGQKPTDARATHWKRPKTLASQLEQLGVKPSDIKYVAVSHTHPDHIGNISMFPQSTLLVQKAEYEWPSPFARALQAGPSAVNKLEGDRDVFSDGSVMLIATPGHTPGHQSLLIKLPNTGALLLSGDAVHFRDNWENRRVPDINFNKEQTSASLQRIADILAKENAQLWINHDKVQRDSLKMAPGFYE